MGVPLVLCSSKTCAEIDVIRRASGSATPSSPRTAGDCRARGVLRQRSRRSEVTEDRVTLALGRPYAEVAALKEVAAAERVSITGFSDMTVSDVATDCGLPLLEAQLAKLRQ